MHIRNFLGALFIGGVLAGGQAFAAPLFQQGFETDTAGWDDSTLGTITRVVDPATAYEGSGYAVVTELAGAGPFTRFGGYSDTFPGDYVARTAIHLDTGWAAGSGFDYSVASSGSDGGHRRDFIFHVTQDTSSGMLLVGGSNNTNFSPRQDLDTLANNYEVTSSGWYIFEHLFRNDGGVLAVDLNLYNAITMALLFTETRSDPSDTIPGVVGGNRYGWFTDVTVAGGLKIDATSLSTVAPIPLPAPVALLAGGLAALGLFGRRRRAG